MTYTVHVSYVVYIEQDQIEDVQQISRSFTNSGDITQIMQILLLTDKYSKEKGSLQDCTLN